MKGPTMWNSSDAPKHPWAARDKTGSTIGGFRVRARNLGMTLTAFIDRIELGEWPCAACKTWRMTKNRAADARRKAAK